MTQDHGASPDGDRAGVNGAGQAVSAVPASVPSALDTAALRAALVGSGRTMACCHPDVLDIELEHDDRKCVLDFGRPQDCDIAESDRYKTKDACPFWQSVNRIIPRQLSIEEGLALVEALKAAQAIEARRTATGTGAVHESAVGLPMRPNSETGATP